MGRKAQEIKIVVHKPDNLESVFNRKEVQDFWTEKIAAILKRNGVTREDCTYLLQEIERRYGDY